MVKIIIEREKCIGCGACVVACPKYFKLENDGKSSLIEAKRNTETNADELEISQAGCAQSAADSCPVQAIHVIS